MPSSRLVTTSAMATSTMTTTMTTTTTSTPVSYFWSAVGQVHLYATNLARGQLIFSFSFALVTPAPRGGNLESRSNIRRWGNSSLRRWGTLCRVGKLKRQKEEKKKLEGVGKNYISPERLKAPGNADCERERKKKREKEKHTRSIRLRLNQQNP